MIFTDRDRIKLEECTVIIYHSIFCFIVFYIIFSFQYLTTVIPYEKKAGSPSVEDLQILTKSECTDVFNNFFYLVCLSAC